MVWLLEDDAETYANN